MRVGVDVGSLVDHTGCVIEVLCLRTIELFQVALSKIFLIKMDKKAIDYRRGVSPTARSDAPRRGGTVTAGDLRHKSQSDPHVV